tara:strand:- start:53 stop:193 length:141 start_codon:yes stop_codon:yes gene_type:complete
VELQVQLQLDILQGVEQQVAKEVKQVEMVVVVTEEQDVEVQELQEQ